MNHLQPCEGVHVHDSWRSNHKVGSCGHALCNAHILRELKYLQQRGQAWAGELAALLTLAWQVARAARHEGGGPVHPALLGIIEREFNRLLSEERAAQPPPAPRQTGQRGQGAKPKGLDLNECLDEHRAQVWRFPYVVAVPFDNNVGERSIRMLKVMQKVMGCWRTEVGAHHHLPIRSAFLTSRNQGTCMLKFLQQTCASI